MATMMIMTLAVMTITILSSATLSSATRHRHSLYGEDTFQPNIQKRSSWWSINTEVKILSNYLTELANKKKAKEAEEARNYLEGIGKRNGMEAKESDDDQASLVGDEVRRGRRDDHTVLEAQLKRGSLKDAA